MFMLQGKKMRCALFAWLISRTFSANEQYFSLTTNQSTVLSAMTYQPSEQGSLYTLLAPINPPQCIFWPCIIFLASSFSLVNVQLEQYPSTCLSFFLSMSCCFKWIRRRTVCSIIRNAKIIYSFIMWPNQFLRIFNTWVPVVIIDQVKMLQQVP